uniref:Pre-mRNA-splicing factor SYF2 n=1 Tax=Peronospora matthiolae TaxID=2874970 RepID=A0AAV1UMU7_9STRA
MSLGFLTESALVPSKAKEIKVDAKSLVDLKAVVFQKEEERKRRLQEALTATNDDHEDERFAAGHRALRFGKYSHLRGGNKRQKQSKEDRVGKNLHNTGVEARGQRDEELKAQEATPAEDDDAAWSKKSVEMLRKKAAMYEKIMSGECRDYLKGECLVDFEAKKSMAETVRTKEMKLVEITDVFGRTKSVAGDSEEYTMFQKTQQQQQCRSEERGDTMKRKICGDGEGRNDEGRVDDGSYVVSQWDKRLNSSEKHHLMEVHEQATSAQLLAHSSSSGVGHDRKTRKQLRLERLRKQRSEAATSGESTVLPNDAVDAAASEKASDFLNQLSAFM